MIDMGEYLKQDVSAYQTLLAAGKRYMEQKLYNGRYFIQKIQWKGLDATDPVLASKHSLDGGYSTEVLELLQAEGPKYQYGNGCLADGVVGDWLARVCRLPEPLDTAKIISHLRSVYSYNLKKDLSSFSNPQRPGYALGNEGGYCFAPGRKEDGFPFLLFTAMKFGLM